MFSYTLLILILGVIFTLTECSSVNNSCSDLSCQCKPKILYERAGAPCCCNCNDNDCRKCSCIRKRFYLDIYGKLNFYSAFEYCRYNGMMLASIDNKEQNDRLHDIIIDMDLQTDGIWVSGSDLGQEGKFIWASNGKPLSYKNFVPGTPDNYGGYEHCLMFAVNGQWNDDRCNAERYFACEYYE